MDADENLLAIFGSLAAGDRGRASQLLEQDPALAVTPLRKGGERGGSPGFLLEDLQHQLYAGDTVLHVAAAAYDVEFANVLVAAGADLEHRDKNGTPPLLRAVRNRCTGAVEALLAAGADPGATNAKGSTALQLTDHSTGRGGSGTAEAKAEQDAIIGLLRAAGASR